MKEIEHVLKWGLAQNPTLTPDPITWTDDDFKTMENSLQYCLPLIRFYSLSSKNFLEKVRPYKKLLKHQLYEDLLKYYLDFESVPSINFSPPRNGKLDSKIINLNIISLVSKWVDKIDISSNFAYQRELYLPYEFKLLLRGSRDGFTPDKFHSLCDDIPKTVTFIKVKGTDEILGGYNPIIWVTNKNWGETKDSFIFSFKYKNGLFKDGIISNVKKINYALNYSQLRGPSFGWDLILRSSNRIEDYDEIYSKQRICLPNFFQNYIEILDDETYDVTIEVGEDPNVKIFHAHTIILCHRSPYLRRVLAKKNNDDSILSHIKLPNILPETFQIILKYIYGGILSLNEQDNLEMLKVLIVANELLLNELVDYLQPYLIENKADWMEKHFELIHRTSFQSNNLLELQKFCTEFMAKDDLRMKEIEVWEHVLKWGLAQNPMLTPDPITWTDDDFKKNLIIIANLLAYIRELYLPYEFKLLIRGSRDGFTPKRFHSLCNNIINNRSVTFIKVKGTDEILGGYTSNMRKMSANSFIFSFKIKNNLFKDGL
ncbi:hypothetical protein RclHR1_10110006 [Rhizophagus clarus]|uniref:BTB domain-containing protein n=1 Tax=Rhizophagus clarus TaxID=94130 RepID=A0A2Z6QEW0_9GLOM|nr:hypothetical protein RclHR1_10110006 [Rhizophagus clarus]